MANVAPEALHSACQLSEQTFINDYPKKVIMEFYVRFMDYSGDFTRIELISSCSDLSTVMINMICSWDPSINLLHPINDPSWPKNLQFFHLWMQRAAATCRFDTFCGVPVEASEGAITPPIPCQQICIILLYYIILYYMLYYIILYYIILYIYIYYVMYIYNYI